MHQPLPLAAAALACAAGVLVAATTVAPAAAAVGGPVGHLVVERGATQPVFSLAEAIREKVYIDADMDSDDDGRPDRIAVQLLRPADTANGLRVASVVNASPYFSLPLSARQNADRLVPARQNADRLVPTPRPAADGSPAPYPHFDAWFDDYFVPRGYAVVEVEMQGTGGSEGCASTGGPEDTLSVKAAVDWLNGRATASYADGTPAVASWSSGAVGMIGVSYGGALSIALAETGVPGLKTIVPIAAISSWYDYARAQGIAYGGFGNRYPEFLAQLVSSETAKAKCADRHRLLGDGADDATADYNAFWRERDYRDDADRIIASVFLVHGQRDTNTKSTHQGRYWDALAAHGVPRKLWLHDGAHIDPFISDLNGRETVGRWMDRWLYDIDNGIEAEPQATIRRPDGTYTTDPAWPAPPARPTCLHLGGPGDDAAGTLRTRPGPRGSQSFTDNYSQLEDTMVSAPDTAKPNRLVYLTPTLATERRLSGTGRLEVTFTATSTSTPLTALLVHYTNGTATRIVARGALDAKNRDSITTGTPLVPGQEYAATVLLEPKDYVFPAGSRIGVVLVANDGQYIVTDRQAAGVTVSLARSRLVLPLTAG